MGAYSRLGAVSVVMVRLDLVTNMVTRNSCADAAMSSRLMFTASLQTDARVPNVNVTLLQIVGKSRASTLLSATV